MALYMGNIPASAYMGDQLVWPTGSPTPPLEGCLTFNIISAGTIVWTLYNSPGFSMEGKPISYSINDGSWQTITATSPGFSFYVDAGEVVKFKGENDNYGEEWSNCNFGSSTAVFEVEGNIMSLIYGENFENQYDFPYGSSYNFSNLFRGCTGLTSVENLILPATALTVGCYQYMFYGCSQIETAPVLPAAVAVDYCYQRMFTNCSSLSYIKCMLTNPDDSNVYRPTYLWVSNVSGRGIFVKDYGVSWGYGDDGIPINWTVQEVTPVFSAVPLTFEILSAGTITRSRYYTETSIDYNLNGAGWTDMNDAGNSISVNAGDNVKFRGNNYTVGNSSVLGYGLFGGTAKFNAYGNIMSLLDGDNYAGMEDFTDAQNTPYSFASLFENCTGLVSIENLVLPATALTESCYDQMFRGCTSLNTIMDRLPATSVQSQSYRHMFSGCTSLSAVDRDIFIALSGGTLPARAASSMFASTSLVVAPILYAQSIGNDTYGAMFRNTNTLVVGPIVCCEYMTSAWTNFLTSTQLRAVAYYATGATARTVSTPAIAPTGGPTPKYFYRYPGATWMTNSPWTVYTNNWALTDLDLNYLEDPRELYDNLVQEFIQ